MEPQQGCPEISITVSIPRPPIKPNLSLKWQDEYVLWYLIPLQLYVLLVFKACLSIELKTKALFIDDNNNNNNNSNNDNNNNDDDNNSNNN